MVTHRKAHRVHSADGVYAIGAGCERLWCRRRLFCVASAYDPETMFALCAIAPRRQPGDDRGDFEQFEWHMRIICLGTNENILHTIKDKQLFQEESAVFCINSSNQKSGLML